MSSDQAPAQVPSVIPAGVPPGLEYLIPTNQIIVKDHNPDLFLPNYHAKEYDIFDAWGRRMYTATETSHAGISDLGYRCREWNIAIFDCTGNPVMSGIRTGAVSCCASNELSATSTANGIHLGGVTQIKSMFLDAWHILDESGAPVFFLDAPYISGDGSVDREFPFYTLNEPREQVGRITKKFPELFDREDVVGVELSVNLDPKLKTVLIYAAFLIDFQFYKKGLKILHKGLTQLNYNKIKKTLYSRLNNNCGGIVSINKLIRYAWLA